MKKFHLIVFLLLLILIVSVGFIFKSLPFSEDECKKLLKGRDATLDFERIDFTPRSNSPTPYGTAKEIKEGVIKEEGIMKFITFTYFDQGFLGCSLRSLPLSSYSINPAAKHYDCSQMENDVYFYYDEKGKYIYTEQLSIDKPSKSGSLNLMYFNKQSIKLEDVLNANEKIFEGWGCVII